MCQANLDTRQDDMEKKFGTHPQMPILYFTQLMGYSFGISPAQVYLNKHLTDAGKIFEKVGQPAYSK
jgi:heterodisulfide reductase subunit B